MRKYILIIIVFVIICSAPAAVAGQVSMASYDFDGDLYDEIIRTDEDNGTTFIRIYSRVENTYFYKPVQVFEAIGRLVQVPEIVDVNKDGTKEYFYATGADMGIIYYHPGLDSYEKTNDYNFTINFMDIDGNSMDNQSEPIEKNNVKLNERSNDNIEEYLLYQDEQPGSKKNVTPENYRRNTSGGSIL